MRYDESVTYLYFASQPWTTVVGSYTYPNNHVLHSVLVKGCASLLGNEPWVLRLPAFLAGVALIPATYALGRRLFGSAEAHVGAALVAGSGSLAFYSTNARGYTIVSLATVVLAILLLRLRGRPAIADWAAVTLTVALGTWTIPIMLFPAGGLVMWFLLSALRGDTSQPRTDLRRLAVALGTAAIVTAELYSPILLRSGMSPLTSNAFVRPSLWYVFFRQLPSSAAPLFSSLTLGTPAILALLLIVLAVAGLVVARRTDRHVVSMIGTMYVWCAAVLLATHRVPFSRVWLFAVAPIALLIARGLTWAASRLGERSRTVATNGGLGGVVVSLALASMILVSRALETTRDTGTLPDADLITQTLSGGLRRGDRVVAPVPSNAPLAFSFVRAGLDTAYLSAQPADSARVYLIVNTGEGFTLRTRLTDPVVRRFSRAELVARFPSAEVYRLF